jgi:hypothetical protein
MPRRQELGQDYLALSCAMLHSEGETAAVLYTFMQTCQAIVPFRDGLVVACNDYVLLT